MPHKAVESFDFDLTGLGHNLLVRIGKDKILFSEEIMQSCKLLVLYSFDAMSIYIFARHTYSITSINKEECCFVPFLDFF